MSLFLGVVICPENEWNETKQLTKQDSLRLQQLLSGQVEIVIDDETQKEIDRLFNPEKWKMKSTPFPKKT